MTENCCTCVTVQKLLEAILPFTFNYLHCTTLQGMWTRFFPAVVELRRQIKEDKIGQVKYVQANFGFKRSDSSSKSRLEDPEKGGGAVLDVGIYPISFATMIFGERPESISAAGWLTSSG